MNVEEFSTIKEQVRQVLSYSQGQDTLLGLDKLMDDWAAAKERFIKEWNGQLIYEIPGGKITFELSKEEKRTRFIEFVDQVDNYWNSSDLAGFLDTQGVDAFYHNIVDVEYEYETWDRELIVIPAGMKLLKAFKYFISSGRRLEDVQNAASRIIQENKIEGVFCMSVHPLDFLSSSENTYKWRSCHALDGECRAGNLSYMCDSATVICYLRGIESAHLPCFPPEVKWNSKKWRMLLFYDESRDLCFAGRQYPFFSQAALDIITDYQNQYYTNKISHHWVWAPTNYWTTWQNEELKTFNGKHLNDVYIYINGHLYPKKDVIQDTLNANGLALHYNDLLYSSFYTPYSSHYVYMKMYEDKKPLIKVGSDVQCLRCGCPRSICTTDTILCEECELGYGSSQDERFGWCACCDRRINVEESEWIPGLGGYVCDDCFETETHRCDNCEEYVYKEYISYNEETDKYLCDRCCNGRRLRPLINLDDYLPF